MAFETKHIPMESVILCTSCRMTLNVCTDDQRTVDRAFQKFQKGHVCRNGMERDGQIMRLQERFNEFK
jgi:hypothetical protein